jgi:hypothetical protein
MTARDDHAGVKGDKPRGPRGGVRCPLCGGDADLGPAIDRITCMFCGYQGPKPGRQTALVEIPALAQQ